MLRDGSVVSQQLEQKQHLCHSGTLLFPLFGLILYWLSYLSIKVTKEEINTVSCLAVSTNVVGEASETS